ncbi:hypothetical protein [Bacillus cereus]|uniref:hypothetical protein n=1 Tax=Bacillus cereus TaxID=1396 RepID=UPI00398121E7
MKKKLLVIFLLSFAMHMSSNQMTMAESQTNVVEKFIQALINRDEKLIKSYVIEGIDIPKMKKGTQICRITGVTSPRKDTKVLIAYFKEKYGENRIAFVWEIIAKNNKISRVKVLYDGTNPFMEEAKIVKEYEMKLKQKVLVPTKFPFEVNRFYGLINNKYLELRYYNESIEGIFKVTASPSSIELEQYKQKHDKFYVLKNGVKVLYRAEFDLAYELRFQKEGVHYTIAIGNKQHLKKKYTVNDLIRIAESMQ